MTAERREIHFSGRVQGVGFRFATQQVARSHAVFGSVQNLTDGRVRVIIEGEAGEIGRFLKHLNETMETCIHSVAQDRLAASGEFSDFQIVY